MTSEQYKDLNEEERKKVCVEKAKKHYELKQKKKDDNQSNV
jgi:hypothetical protein